MVNNFGQFVATQRHAIGWSQEELAERSTLSVRTIRNLETGSITSPRKSSVDLVVEALNSTGRGERGPAPDGWSPFASASGVAQFGPPASYPATASGVPADTDPLVGRERDLAEIARILSRQRHVVLTGPGGVGKTRLALTASAQMRAAYPDGVTLIELGSLSAEGTEPARDAEHLMRRVVAAVNPGRPPGADPLSPHSLMLLVIDNAEHLARPTALLGRQLLDTFPCLHLIVTSRRPLPAPSLPAWEVRPLSVEGDEPEALTLFQRRARAACPTLDLTGHRDTVLDLCARLDGIPLAIELAALRLRSLSLDTLVRADPITTLLGWDDPAGLPQHRTLVSSVQWSYGLLSPDQRALLHVVADAFPGSFTIDDAKHLRCDSDGGPSGVMRGLAELVDSSLVQVRRGSTYVYRLLGYVREFLLSVPASARAELSRAV
jgi:predicted ATPase